MNISYEKFDNLFLQKSYTWLKDTEIKNLTRTPIFSQKEQQNWFDSLKNKDNYKIWGISFNGIAIGACGLKNIKNNTGEYWGYIGEKKYWGKGIGKNMIEFITDYSKQQKIEKIYLHVLNSNIRAIKLYEKSLFNQVSVSENVIKMEKVLEVQYD